VDKLLDGITVNSELFLLQLQTKYSGIIALQTYFVTHLRTYGSDLCKIVQEASLQAH
jgi:hypothetical protein